MDAQAGRESRVSQIDKALNRLENTISLVSALKRDIKGEPIPPASKDLSARNPSRPLAALLSELPAILDEMGKRLAAEIEEIRELLF